MISVTGYPIKSVAVADGKTTHVTFDEKIQITKDFFVGSVSVGITGESEAGMTIYKNWSRIPTSRGSEVCIGE